jgi:hypothetical protein
MIALCLGAGGGALLPLMAFTLAWTHSVERLRWEEDYRVAGDRLELVEARIHGSGAGMEPPPDARLEAGWWRYRPPLPPLPELTLAGSGFGGDYELCAGRSCRAMSSWRPLEAGSAPIRIRPCTGSAADCCAG